MCVCIYKGTYSCVCVYINVTKIWCSTQLSSIGASGHSAHFLPGLFDISYTSVCVLLPCLAPEHTSSVLNSSVLDYVVETGQELSF